MKDIGKIVGKHRLSASSSLVLLLLGAMFVSLGVFLSLVVHKAAPEGQRLITQVMFGAGLLGVVLMTWGGLLRRRGSLLLAERGVRVVKAGRSQDYLFEEISETCQLYQTGLAVGIAFRAGPDAAWECASAHLSGYSKFRQGLLDGYIAAKLPVVLRALEQGQTSYFRVTNLTGKVQGAFATSIESYVHAQTERVSLDQRALRFGDQEVELARLSKIEHNPWTGNIILTLDDGRQPTLSFSSLFEPELLLGALEQARA